MDERLRALSEVISEGFMQIRDGCLVMSNAQLVQAAGRGGAGLIGMKVADLFREEGDGLPRPGAPDPLECTLQTSDGRSRSVICRRAFQEGESEAWVVDDVTDRRDVARELLRAGQDLARSNRELEASRNLLSRERKEREELVSLVSHELRTPLTVISGYTKLLLCEEVGPLTEEQRRFLEESRKSSERLAGFISNILDAARLTHQSDILEISNGPIGPVLEGVAGMFRPLFEQAGLALRLDLEAGVRVRFDRLRVEQILTNLLGNALKYVPSGGQVGVTLRSTRRDDGRPFVEITVEDDGPGIANAQREQVFEPYVQLGDGERRDGLGLGLSICQRLVEAHGGEIRLGDSPGGGARFAFTLPSSGASCPDVVEEG